MGQVTYGKEARSWTTRSLVSGAEAPNGLPPPLHHRSRRVLGAMQGDHVRLATHATHATPATPAKTATQSKGSQWTVVEIT